MKRLYMIFAARGKERKKLMISELVNNLREDAEWAHANEWEVPITLGDHLDTAAGLIEQLSALKQNGDSAIDTNKRLVEVVYNLQKEYEQAKANCEYYRMMYQELVAIYNNLSLRKHGYWINYLTNDDWTCSECNFVQDCGPFLPKELNLNYCPSCGAIMDLEEI